MTERLYVFVNIFSPFHSPDEEHLFYIRIYALIRFPMQRLVKRMAKTRQILHLDLDAFFWGIIYFDTLEPLDKQFNLGYHCSYIQ